MVYKISIRIIDASLVKFSVVEKTVWYHVGGTWSECDGIHTIIMNDIGSSGALRFSNAHNESFIVVAGLTGPGEQHWSAIVTDLGVDYTALWIHPRFYGEAKLPWTNEKEESKRSEKGTQVTTRFVARRETSTSCMSLFMHQIQTYLDQTSLRKFVFDGIL